MISILNFIPAHNPGIIEDLTDLFAKDWAKLGSVRKIGDSSKLFFCCEMEATWGQKHLAVLPEDEAEKWILGVSNFSLKSDLEVAS